MTGTIAQPFIRNYVLSGRPASNAPHPSDKDTLVVAHIDTGCEELLGVVYDPIPEWLERAKLVRNGDLVIFDRDGLVVLNNGTTDLIVHIEYIRYIINERGCNSEEYPLSKAALAALISKRYRQSGGKVAGGIRNAPQ